jgi:hypothetical protein
LIKDAIQRNNEKYSAKLNQLENKIQQLELSLNDASNLVNQKDLEIESLTRTSDKLKDEYNSKLSDLEVVNYLNVIYLK